MRNVVLVTVDSLRADHCGFINEKYDLTPTLDLMADDGLAFENAIVPGPRTPSSMPVIWTGEHIDTRNFGVYSDYKGKKTTTTERRERIRRHLTRYWTLPERLSERGYNTAGITVNPWTAKDTVFDRGFDSFHALGESSGLQRDDLVAKIGEKATDGNLQEWLLRWTDFYSTIEETRSKLEEPYFLWVFLLDPHQPYFTPRQYRAENTFIEMYYANYRQAEEFYTNELSDHLRTRIKRSYRDTVRSVDSFTRKILDDFEVDDPVFVFHSDHGEAFGEHGFYGHRPQLYEENIHVPLLVHGMESSTTVREPISLRYLPRIIEACSVGSFHPEAVTSPTVIAKTEEKERITARTADWKFIQGGEDWEYVRGGEGEELYYLPDDADERSNLVRVRTEVTRHMKELIHSHQESQTERDRIARTVGEIEL